MEHAIFAIFLITLIAGLISLCNAVAIFLRTRDTVIRYFAILFSGLSSQILAHLALAYFLIAGGNVAGPLFHSLAASVGFSICLMTFAVVRATELICGGQGSGPRVITALVISSLAFFLCLFSATVDPATGSVRFNSFALSLFILPVSILYAIARGFRFIRTERTGEKRDCIKAVTILALVFFPFFCFSFIRPVLSRSLAVGVNMFSVLPFSVFYLAVCLSFTVFVNRKYLALLSGARFPAIPGEEFFRDHGITPREREVMSLILEGDDNKSIARKLGIAVNTVKVHTASLFRKLNVQSRFGLTKFCAYREPSSQ